MDTWAVDLLLRAGADPNICTTSSPLQFAAWNSDIQGMKLLLEAGAIASYKDHHGTNALSYAAMKTTDVEIYKVLLSAGICIEERSVWSQTPLMYAAINENVYGMKILLDFGSKLDEQDADGNTALMSAIFKTQNKSTQYLLRRGADHTLPDHAGNTILHQVALSGNLETLDILRATNLPRIDPQKPNKSGKTAFQLAQERLSKPHGFIELFLTLIWEIRNRNDYLAGHRNRSDGASYTGLDLGGHDSTTAGPSVLAQPDMAPMPTSFRQNNDPKPRSTLYV